MQAITQATKQAAERLESELLDAIIRNGLIRSVYQPIVSLKDGRVYGYEALSRITCSAPGMDIARLFRVADRDGRAWELESLCRAKALEGAAALVQGAKLFLNVNHGVLDDHRPSEGIQDHHLERAGLDTGNIIFEVAERSAVAASHAFHLSIGHYRGQGYKIAIDDVSAGHSGWKAITAIKPNMIKLDMHMVRGIDKDKTKRLVCASMVDFAKGSGIGMVAEGVETEAELATLIGLDVDYGQGFFLGIPRKGFTSPSPFVQRFLLKYNSGVIRP